MGGGFFRIPPRGTQVIVAIPEPFGNVPGASVIVQTIDVTTGAPIYGNMKPGEFCIGTPGSAARIITKANGTIVLYTTSDNTPAGKSLSLEIGPNSFKITHQMGALSIDADGVTLTAGDAALTLSPEGIAKLLGQQVAVQGSLVAVAGTVATCIGDGCVPVPTLNNAIAGASGVTGGPAPKVYISLTP